MKILSTIFSLLFCAVGFAQEVPLNNNFSSSLLGDIYQADSLINYTIKPLIPQYHNFEYTHPAKRPYRSYAARKLFFEPFIVIDTSDFQVTINPLFLLEAGTDSKADEKDVLIQNTRGFQVRGTWKNKLTFTASFYENQAKYPDYLNRFIIVNGVVPGQGRVKNFKDGGYDFAMASARINYIPNNHLMISIGQDKNFIGEGYRSLLLSDNSFNYPFISSQVNFFDRKLNYMSMIAGLQDLVRVDGFAQTENIFQRKTASYHFLEYNPLPSLRIGLFESTVLVDAMARQGNGPRVKANYSFLNPIIGLNSLINGKNDELVHSIQGVNLSFRPLNTMLVYGQLAFNELDLSNAAIQIGAIFSGIEGLLWRGEWNHSGTNVIGSTIESASQSHYNQFLGHAYGERFSEVLMLLNYKYKRFVMELGGNYTIYDKAILRPGGYHQYLLNNEQIIGRAELGIVVNPATNMQFSVGMLERMGKIRESPDDFSSNTSYLYVSFKTALINRYRDF